MYELLRKVPLFAGLPDTDSEHLRRVVGKVWPSAGEELFAEDSPGGRALAV